MNITLLLPDTNSFCMKNNRYVMNPTEGALALSSSPAESLVRLLDWKQRRFILSNLGHLELQGVVRTSAEPWYSWPVCGFSKAFTIKVVCLTEFSKVRGHSVKESRLCGRRVMSQCCVFCRPGVMGRASGIARFLNASSWSSGLKGSSSTSPLWTWRGEIQLLLSTLNLAV